MSDKKLDEGVDPEEPMSPEASLEIDAVSNPDPTPDSVKKAVDWWRCYRIGPVSGRYEGDMISPSTGRYALDLRVDIDPRYANSPVMERVSADLYRKYAFRWFGKEYSWRVYQESWIIDAPELTWHRCHVEIDGEVRYWNGGHFATTAAITIPWGSFKAAGPARVTLSTSDGQTQVYECARKSHAFREITLEVDYCNSVNQSPTMPSYDTDLHNNRPSGLPQRVLDIREAYLEAGIDMAINPTHTIIDDSAPEFDTWSPDELHDAMEQHFSDYKGAWPKWHMWCILAGTYEKSSVGGIMFDAKAIYGGAGEAPDRQGCAVFRNHGWFNQLVDNPTTQAQAAAMRKLLYTYVHEIGHAFNFLHSWDKARPDALSWMNYDWKYDQRNGANEFWKNFEFRFDDDELIHIRHGNRAAVIMGGDDWASGGHIELTSDVFADAEGELPIELLVRSPAYFDFMQPVSLEFRLKNLSDLTLELDTRLNPEYGGVVVYIQKPNGRTVQYSPILCKVATPETTQLKPLQKNEKNKGDDRFSENVFLSFGVDGYYFDNPGEYLVKAVYHGGGDILIPSNVHRIRIGRPFERAEERIAQDYFNYSTGMALYLEGSSSPYLDSGMNTLHEIVERFPKSRLAAQTKLTFAKNLKRDFYRIEEDKRKLKLYRQAEPEKVLGLTAETLQHQKEDENTLTNLDYHEVRRLRVDTLAQIGEITEAKEEINQTVEYLKQKGVNQPVLKKITAYGDDLGKGKRKRKPR
jgi:hypothetical protein